MLLVEKRSRSEDDICSPIPFLNSITCLRPHGPEESAASSPARRKRSEMQMEKGGEDEEMYDKTLNVVFGSVVVKKWEYGEVREE